MNQEYQKNDQVAPMSIDPIVLKRNLDSLRVHAGPEMLAALEDPLTCEVMLNPDGRLWCEKLGGEGAPMRQIGVMDRHRAQSICEVVAGCLGKIITPEKPQLDGEWPLDGSRFSGAVPPIVAAPMFSIRKRASRVLTLDEYVAQGVMTPRQREEIGRAVAMRRNIVVVGGTSSGKTTFTNALIGEMVRVEPDVRLIIAEDTLEIQCGGANVIFMHTSDTVSMTLLLKQMLRLRPDRIVIGEVRDHAALDVMDAWNTGHEGGIATLHASSALRGLSRLRGLISRNPHAPDDIEEIIGEAAHRIVYLERKPEVGRRVKEILAVDGYNRATGTYNTRRLDDEQRPWRPVYMDIRAMRKAAKAA